VTNMVCSDYEVVKCAVCGHKTQDGYQIVSGKVVCDECGEAWEIRAGKAPNDRVTNVDAKGVRALARISYQGREYILDDRLWELRPADEPWANIPLSSALAGRIISEGTCITRARYLW